MKRSDHPVFKRPTRQQLITRRRSVGLQALVFATSVEPLRCRRCARTFNAMWKAFLCHVCGLWTCCSCSSVIERERDVHVVCFVRACTACMTLVNKWPDPALLADYVATPWVGASSKCQLGLNLADALRTRKPCRGAVLTLLHHLGRPIGADHHAMLDDIGEHDWVSTMNHMQDDQNYSGLDVDLGIAAAVAAAAEHSIMCSSRASVRHGARQPRREARAAAHMIVQQCFDVSVAELPISECVFAESDGVRSYPIVYEEGTEHPMDPPVISTEAERVQHILKYRLTRSDANMIELQVICDLAAKELDAASSFISIVHGDVRQSAACRPEGQVGQCGVVAKRVYAMCAYALATSDRPFLVRDTALDFRFRSLEVVVGEAGIRFYLGFPIIASCGVQIASLCVLDTKPHRQITTMQYSILKALAAIITAIWEEKHRRSIDMGTTEQAAL